MASFASIPQEVTTAFLVTASHSASHQAKWVGRRRLPSHSIRNYSSEFWLYSVEQRPPSHHSPVIRVCR